MSGVTELGGFQKIRLAHDAGKNGEHLPAAHGHFSKQFYRRMFAALELAPSVVEHVVSLRDSKGGTDDKVDGTREAPMPWNTQAVNDANEIYQRLVYWSILWAQKLHRQAPGPAVRAWRARDGFVVGLPVNIAPADARYISGVMATWLRISLDDICWLTPVDDVVYFHDELKDVFRVNARWPQTSKPRYSDLPCPTCKGRIAMYPPKDVGDDELIKCENCGLHLPPGKYEFFIGVFKQIRAEKNPVARHLMRKYGGTA